MTMRKIDPEQVRTLLDSGLSQAAVSRALGCSRQYVHRLKFARYTKTSTPMVPPGSIPTVDKPLLSPNQNNNPVPSRIPDTSLISSALDKNVKLNNSNDNTPSKNIHMVESTEIKPAIRKESRPRDPFLEDGREDSICWFSSQGPLDGQLRPVRRKLSDDLKELLG